MERKDKEDEIESLAAEYLADKEKLAKLMDRTKKLHIKEGLPATFVGISVHIRSLVEMMAASMKLAETQKTDPDDVWGTLRSAWGCLLDRLTDLATDDDQNIGMTTIQWSAFVMLGLYFDNKGDFKKCAETAALIIKKAMEGEIRQKKEAKDGGGAEERQQQEDGGASPTTH